jgi:hypothetical protein
MLSSFQSTEMSSKHTWHNQAVRFRSRIALSTRCKVSKCFVASSNPFEGFQKANQGHTNPPRLTVNLSWLYMALVLGRTYFSLAAAKQSCQQGI